MEVSILTRPEGRVQPIVLMAWRTWWRRFNPHPSRRTGATPSLRTFLNTQDLFQSSPVPKDGCNGQVRPEIDVAALVSILTRPEGRVQPWR